jgi:dihydrofolate reductase
MARLVFGLMQSLDGYVSGPEGGPGLPMPDDVLTAHFSDQLRRTTGSLYGRRMYEIMRYWDQDEAEQEEAGREFALAWRSKPKWVVSRTLKSVGPNATLVDGDLETFVRALKAEQEGEIEVAGPELAGNLAKLGLSSTCARSCSAAASLFSPVPGRRSASSPANRSVTR